VRAAPGGRRPGGPRWSPSGARIAWVDAFGKLRVGPQSAGAVPGPVAYGRGGSRLTTTDANLALGFTFSTIATTQLQAMQAAVFFLLPSILLSGFAFPFRGMPVWAQWVGELMPATYFLRIVRGILLKGNEWAQIWPNIWPLLIFLVVVGGIALLRYRRTLD